MYIQIDEIYTCIEYQEIQQVYSKYIQIDDI
jgi:hypothetical protein